MFRTRKGVVCRRVQSISRYSVSCSNKIKKIECDEAEDSKAGWLGYSLVAWILCWCIILAVRFIALWTQCASGKDDRTVWPAFQALLLLGTEVCLLAMAALIALVVPPLIMTWTIALVFEFLFGHVINRVGNAVHKADESEMKKCFESRDKLIRSGARIAKEISRFNPTAAGVVAVCFIAMICLRGYLSNVS